MKLVECVNSLTCNNTDPGLADITGLIEQAFPAHDYFIKEPKREC